MLRATPSNQEVWPFFSLQFCFTINSFHSKIEFMEDTIVAIASAAGEGGIGIIRISGEKSKDILRDIFVPILHKKEDEKSLGEEKNKDVDKNEINTFDDINNARKLIYGNIVDPDSQSIIDEVLAVYMPSPGTYTKEDIVEIDCHGGSTTLAKVLQLIIRRGARLAEPGEFTKRAFLNGRIDLSQAEAVLDVINAKTDDSLTVAVRQLQGKFSEEIKELRRNLTDILVDVDVNIDYPDEDIEEITYRSLEERLEITLSHINELLSSAKTGKILREGLKVAIVGKPNAGKSSLLNLLLKESRAIVTDIPGTTRDTIEEFANIRGVPVKLTDTAGIRETTDQIEKIGIERSKQSQEESDLTILMVDLSDAKDELAFDDEVKSLIKNAVPEKTILLFNKKDKIDEETSKKIEEEIEKLSNNEGQPFAEYLSCSLLNNNDDVRKIEDAIFRMSGYAPVEKKESKSGRDSSVVTNVRHRAMLECAAKSIEDGIASLRMGAPLELIEIDVRNAYEHLGFITGDSVQDDIIDEIFSRFCLGK